MPDANGTPVAIASARAAEKRAEKGDMLDSMQGLIAYGLKDKGKVLKNR